MISLRCRVTFFLVLRHCGGRQRYGPWFSKLPTLLESDPSGNMYSIMTTRFLRPPGRLSLSEAGAMHSPQMRQCRSAGSASSHAIQTTTGRLNRVVSGVVWPSQPNMSLVTCVSVHGGSSARPEYIWRRRCWTTEVTSDWRRSHPPTKAQRRRVGDAPAMSVPL